VPPVARPVRVAQLGTTPEATIRVRPALRATGETPVTQAAAVTAVKPVARSTCALVS